MSREFLPAARTGAILLKSKDGFTLHDDGTPVTPRDTWAVSLADGITFDHEPDVEELAATFAALRASEPWLDAGRPTYLGSWFDEETGEYCIDLTVLIDEREDALKFASQQQGQKTIYNLKTGVTLPVPVLVG